MTLSLTVDPNHASVHYPEEATSEEEEAGLDSVGGDVYEE